MEPKQDWIGEELNSDGVWEDYNIPLVEKDFTIIASHEQMELIESILASINYSWMYGHGIAIKIFLDGDGVYLPEVYHKNNLLETKKDIEDIKDMEIFF